MNSIALLTQSTFFAPAMTLALVPDCSAGTSSASCNLGGLLHLLFVIAGVLGVILIAVIAFAVHAWRKSKEADLINR